MVARKHGISSGLLYTWRQRLLCGALGAVADTKPRFVRVDVVAGARSRLLVPVTIAGPVITAAWAFGFRGGRFGR